MLQKCLEAILKEVDGVGDWEVKSEIDWTTARSMEEFDGDYETCPQAGHLHSNRPLIFAA